MASLLLLGTGVVAKVLVGARQFYRFLPPRTLFLEGCDAVGRLASHFLLCLACSYSVHPKGIKFFYSFCAASREVVASPRPFGRVQVC